MDNETYTNGPLKDDRFTIDNASFKLLEGPYTDNVDISLDGIEYNVPSVSHQSGYPYNSFVAIILKLHERVEQLETEIMEMKNG